MRVEALPIAKPRWVFAIAILALCAGFLLPLDAVSRLGEKDTLTDAAKYLHPSIVPGQTISQVFSRTISLKGDGIDPLVRRVSGTAAYRVTAVTAHEYTFEAKFLYDGRPDAVGTSQIRRDGQETCWEGQCSNATDASGLLFNPLIWGVPPATLAVGTRWHTRIAIPWELGPAGLEDVTVVKLDGTTDTITLMRQGSGDGPFDNDKTQLKVMSKGNEYTVDAKPGHASWTGFTTISKGIITSDELLVERSLTLSSKELGTISASERQYILLNQMPHASSWD